MLNFDFFQPYKHTISSYGALYLTLMNLPRTRSIFKQENVILVGIIPPFEHEPPTLNPFLRPSCPVDELKVAVGVWSSSATHQNHPGYQTFVYN